MGGAYIGCVNTTEDRDLFVIAGVCELCVYYIDIM